jgi:hypothetical protein
MTPDTARQDLALALLQKVWDYRAAKHFPNGISTETAQ